MRNFEKPAANYDSKFFEQINALSLASARVIVPIVMDLVHPRTVLDVGCGQGAWLRVFLDHGVTDARGFDGAYVDMERLMIEPACFKPVNLEKTLEVDGEYDLAVCLEVVEHLSAGAGTSLVGTLTRVAPVVLFSAAIPGQGGVHHVNEQLPNYWEERFSRVGYRRLDPVRSRIWKDNRIPWFFRQNILLYASDQAIQNSEVLRAELRAAETSDLELVHRSVLVKYVVPSKLGFGQLIQLLLRLPLRSVKSRLKRLGWI